jgi:hypothetical protein
MTRTAFCPKSSRVPRGYCIGSWALGANDRGGQDKARKVRAVGRGGEHREIPAIRQTLRHIRRTLRLSVTRYRRSTFDTL